MIDPSTLATSIQSQISSSVDQSIREHLDRIIQDLSPTLIQKIEKQINDSVALTFEQKIKQIDVDQLIAGAVDETLIQIIDPAEQNDIQDQIANTVDDHIRAYIENIIRELSLDAAWIGKIEHQINDTISRKFSRKLNLVDIDSLIAQSMDAAIDRYHARQPKKQSGVEDTATQIQMIVDDHGLTVQNDLRTPVLTVDRDASVGGTLSVQNIAVRGTINTDNKAWQRLVTELSDITLDKLNQEWRAQLVTEVKQQITDSGIDFDQVNVAGSAVIKDGHLNDNITTSNLRSVGMLDQLCVKGNVDMLDSLSVRNRRIGINTQHPDMALSVWDEEVSLAFGKHKQQTAYLGTLKPQAMVIGINRQPAIDITDQGRVTINYLTVGRHRVCHEAEIPNYSGTKGDIVFNSNPRGDGVWGWQCLGAFKWTPLRSG